jgi:hypothetical protein
MGRSLESQMKRARELARKERRERKQEKKAAREAARVGGPDESLATDEQPDEDGAEPGENGAEEVIELKGALEEPSE